MNLRKKIFFFSLFIIIVMIVGVVINYVYSLSIIDAALKSHFQQNLTIAQSALNTKVDRQKFFARDYSLWDDMANAVLTKDLAWIETELFGPLEIYESDAVWIYDSQKIEIFSKSRGEKPFFIQAFDISEMQNVSLLRDVVTYFHTENDQPITYHVAPILFHTDAEKNASPHGYFVVAKKWYPEDFDDLSNMINGSVTFSRSDVMKDSEHIDVKLPLKNERTETIGYLTFSFSDTSVQFLSQAVIFQIVMTTILGALGIVASIFILKRWIIIPTEKLIEKLKSSSLLMHLPHTAHSQNEFNILSELIDVSIQQNEITKRLSLAIDNATDAFIITDAQNNILYVNPAWEKLNGYLLSEALGKNPRILHSGKTSQTVYKEMWSQLSEGNSFTTEAIINKRKDGREYFAHISVFPIRDNEENKFFVGIAQDITERLSVDKLKTQFISLASHQLRTPLSALRWLSELLEGRFSKGLTEEQLDIVSDIYESTLQMIKLVNDLLNVSRIESGRVLIQAQTFSPKELTEEVLHLFRLQLSKKEISVQTAYPHEEKTITVDRLLFREVLINLLSNAIKYTPEKGTISITMAFDKDVLITSVSDTGIGMPKSEQSKIFSQFFRATNAQRLQESGTGLGLYLVKLILNALQGSIHFESEEGKGTTFHFRVPIHSEIQTTGEVKLTPTNQG